MQQALARIVPILTALVSLVLFDGYSQNLLVLNDAAPASVLRFNGTTGAFIDTFVAPGSGGLAMDLAGAMKFGPDTNLYVLDNNSSGAGFVSRFNGATGAFIDTFVAPASGNLRAATAMAFGPDHNLYIADSNDRNVKRFNGVNGAFIDVFTAGYTLASPQSETFGPDGNLYVADEISIVRFNGTSGAFMNVFVAAATPPNGPSGGLLFGMDGNLYAGLPGSNAVARYNGTTGAFIDFFVSPGAGGLNGPRNLAFGPDGNFYVASDSGVLRYNGTTGAFMNVFVPPGSGGLSVASDLIFVSPAPTPLYHVCLLYDPTKVVKSGATLPVKLQLCDGSGNDLSSSTITLHATSITQVSSSISGEVQDAGNANPDNDFRFDSTLGPTGGYIFNLKTTGLATGTFNLNFTVTGDSVAYAAPFQVK